MSEATSVIKLGGSKFHIIGLQDKPLFSQFVKETQYPANLWSSNFDYLWTVSDPQSDEVLWKEVDGMLCIFKMYLKTHLSLAILPLGKGSPDKLVQVVRKCLEFCKKWNGNGKAPFVRAVNDSQVAFMSRSAAYRKHFAHTPIPGRDRHLGIQNLLTLSGREFQNVRTCINQFKRMHPGAVFRKAAPEDRLGLLKLKQTWNETSGQKYRVIWDDLAYSRLVTYFQQLGHLIFVVEDKGSLVGMVSGEILPHGEAWGNESKKLEPYYGLSEFMLVEFAKELRRVHPKVQLINLGMDAGEGLRTYKDKYRPVLNAERFRMYLK